MRILIYEHLTACGTGAASLQAEGRAMREAVTEDFGRIAQVTITHDPDDTYDAALLIAPESHGVLMHWAMRVENAGRRLLSPPSRFCAWAGDKTRATNTLAAAGIRVPPGLLLQPNDPWPKCIPAATRGPIVVKPNDGCGSQGVRLLTSSEGDRYVGRRAAEVAARTGDYDGDERSIGPLRLESFIAGQAASIALLRGPTGIVPLPACSQDLSDDGRLTYRGGRCPLPTPLAVRAQTLALRAATAMPMWQGFVGLDLVLGAADDGTQDFVIEVNPRLTTSYVGLRAKCATNLAEAMLVVVAGRLPQICVLPGEVAFDAAGQVSYRRDQI